MIEIGEGIIPPEQSTKPGSYRDIDLLLFCAFEGKLIQQDDRSSFGDRRQTWAIQGEELESMAKSAERDGEWHPHSTISYAFTMNEEKEMPAIAVFDSSKMVRAGNMPDQKDVPEAWKQDGYIVQNGYTMDEAAIAVFYLPS